MTIKLTNERGSIPLWGAITVVLSIFMAVSGLVWGAVQKGADVEHRILAQQIQIDDNEISALQANDAQKTLALADIKADIAAIKEQAKRIPIIESAVTELVKRSK